MGTSASSFTSVISIYPGVCEIQNDTLEFSIAFCGVTPHAQKKFTSSFNNGLGLLPQSG